MAESYIRSRNRDGRGRHATTLGPQTLLLLGERFSVAPSWFSRCSTEASFAEACNVYCPPTALHSARLRSLLSCVKLGKNHSRNVNPLCQKLWLHLLHDVVAVKHRKKWLTLLSSKLADIMQVSVCVRVFAQLNSLMHGADDIRFLLSVDRCNGTQRCGFA